VKERQNEGQRSRIASLHLFRSRLPTRPSHLLLGGSESHPSTWVTLDLVDQKNSNMKLLSDTSETTQHLVQALLTFTQLPSSRVVGSEQSHDRVDDQKSVATFFGEFGC